MGSGTAAHGGGDTTTGRRRRGWATGGGHGIQEGEGHDIPPVSGAPGAEGCTRCRGPWSGGRGRELWYRMPVQDAGWGLAFGRRAAGGGCGSVVTGTGVGGTVGGYGSAVLLARAGNAETGEGTGGLTHNIQHWGYNTQAQDVDRVTGTGDREQVWRTGHDMRHRYGAQGRAAPKIARGRGTLPLRATPKIGR